MKIAVLSDTHVRTLDQIPPLVLRALDGVDLILHAGDFTEKAVLDGLKTLAEVRAVCGNMDSGELKRTLPQTDLFVINGKRIGLTHGSGPPWGIKRRVRHMFGDVDLIIYGHSHSADSQHVKGSLLFNPGRARESFGLLTIDDVISTQIVKL